jgi:predicted nuclease of predicted toxin-antitoxin system
LLLDQDVYFATEVYLRDLGHDVLTATQSGLATASDEEMLNQASIERRLLVTRDRHFGSLVFVKGLITGVLYLRMRTGV